MNHAHRIVVASLAAAALIASPVYAQDVESPDHAALRTIRAAYEKAVADNDLELIKPHLHPDFTAVMVTGREVAGYNELVNYWGDIRDLIGDGGSYQVKVAPSELSRVFGDTALAHGMTEDRVVTGRGAVYEFTGLWTAVLRKHDGEWKVLRIHGSMDPIDNPFIAAKSRQTATWYGLGGIAIGGIGASCLFLARGRR